MTASPSQFEWPKESAERIAFQVPKEWKVRHKICRLCFDSEQRLIEVVATIADTPNDNNEKEVLDIIDPTDIIGVKLEVGNNPNEGVTSMLESNKDLNGAAEVVLANDPQGDHGPSVLHIYRYPRLDPSQASCLARCGLAEHRHPVTNPTFSPQSLENLSNVSPRKFHPLSLIISSADKVVAKDYKLLVKALKHLASPAMSYDGARPRPIYLIVVNPKSGPKKDSMQICQNILLPMLKQAEIDSVVCVTTHSKHGLEMMSQNGVPTKSDNEKNKEKEPNVGNDVSDYDGLIVLGGDGTFHEIVNGIAQRPDSEVIWKKVKIGVIGCGSGNGLATSIAYASNEKYGPLQESFLICKGKCLFIDLSTYKTLTRSYISFLTFTWAMVADIDIESERIHWVGEARFDIWAVIRILFLRTYRAKFSYLPASKVADKSKTISEMPALDSPVSSSWVTIEDDFVLFWASLVSHASMTNMPTPGSKLNDGAFRIFMIRKGISRLQLIRMLLVLESGGHAAIPGAEFIDCVAYRLEPQSPGSFNDLDGEPVESGPIQAHVMPSTMQVFCDSLP